MRMRLSSRISNSTIPLNRRTTQSIPRISQRPPRCGRCVFGAIDSRIAITGGKPTTLIGRMARFKATDVEVGRPGRASGFERFLDHVVKRRDVWICRGVDIARHWRQHHPYVKGT